MLDKIILGMLSLKELTVYDLKKALDKSINHFYTTSYGSIHPALVKLEKNEMVEISEFVDRGRSKKLYSITEKGKTDFKQWLSGDIHVSRLKEDSLVKLFFFGMLDSESRRSIIGNYLVAIDDAMKSLQQLREQVQKVEVPDEFSNIARFQIETLNYGIDHSIFMNNWFNDFLKNRTDEEIIK